MHSNQMSFNRTTARLLAPLAACLVLSGCGNEVPSEQVIARVDGRDVTITEFEFETERQPAAPPTADDIAVLEVITRRKVLAQIAEERGLEQEPRYHFEFRRAREALLVDALYRELESDTPAPSDPQIVAYIARHAWQFAERRVLVLSTGNGETARQTTIDTAGFLEQPPFPIMTIAPGQKMLWQGAVHDVLDVREVPPAPGEARTWASDRLKVQRVEEKLVSLYGRALESGQLQYAPGYGPSGTQRRLGD